MPFVLQERIHYLQMIQKDIIRRPTMNWIFETYSNIYNTAMMQPSRHQVYAASAKNNSEPKASFLARLFRRG